MRAGEAVLKVCFRGAPEHQSQKLSAGLNGTVHATLFSEFDGVFKGERRDPCNFIGVLSNQLRHKLQT
jgi:hypothetical protein